MFSRRPLPIFFYAKITQRQMTRNVSSRLKVTEQMANCPKVYISIKSFNCEGDLCIYKTLLCSFKSAIAFDSLWSGKQTMTNLTAKLFTDDFSLHNGKHTSLKLACHTLLDEA